MRAALPAGTTLSDNSGDDLAHNELTMRRAFLGVNDGCLVHLGLPAGHPFAVMMTHPRLDWVRFATDFSPFKTALWASRQYALLRTVPGAGSRLRESREWTLTYEFGPVQTGR